MIIYSVEINIDQDVSEKWVEWMLKKHIPDVMKTQLFSNFKFKKILNSKNQNLYTIEYEMESMEQYFKYKNNFANNLQKEHAKKFENKFSSKRDLFIRTNNVD